MDGKPLYEYARESKPLPRPIAARKVTVHALRLTRFSRGAEHSFDWPTKTFESLDEKAAFLRLEQMVEQGQTDVLASAAGTEDAEHADGDASERELGNASSLMPLSAAAPPSKLSTSPRIVPQRSDQPSLRSR